MTRDLRRVAVALAAAFLFHSFPVAQSADFGGYRPHYQGYGTTTPGGRGGIVVKVTNLNDSGAGSFRRAVAPRPGCVDTAATCARIVVFETSGTIAVQSRISISSPYLTIAGQTAPSPGITIRDKQIRVESHDIVMQHIRVRLGDRNAAGVADQAHDDAVWVRGEIGVGSVYNLVLDHISGSWGKDETIGFNAASGPEPKDISMLDTIVAETLGFPFSDFNPVANDHQGTMHARGLLTGPNADGTLTVMRTLFMSNDVRNPSIRSGWRAALVNNLVYNYAKESQGATNNGGTAFVCGGGELSGIEGVQVGSVAIPGPDTLFNQRKPIKMNGTVTGRCPSSTFYFENNVGPSITGPTGDGQWSGVDLGGANEAAIRLNSKPSWYAVFNYKEMPSSQVEACIKVNAGARPLDRDAVDLRLMSEMSSRAGSVKLLNPAFPVLAVNTRMYNVPAKANSPGNCGTAGGVVRTVIECDLEAKARVLENFAACASLPSASRLAVASRDQASRLGTAGRLFWFQSQSPWPRVGRTTAGRSWMGPLELSSRVPAS